MVKIKVSFNDKVFCHEFISQQRYTPIPSAMRQQSSESLPASGIVDPAILKCGPVTSERICYSRSDLLNLSESDLAKRRPEHVDEEKSWYQGLFENIKRPPIPLHRRYESGSGGSQNCVNTAQNNLGNYNNRNGPGSGSAAIVAPNVFYPFAVDFFRSTGIFRDGGGDGDCRNIMLPAADRHRSFCHDFEKYRYGNNNNNSNNNARYSENRHYGNSNFNRNNYQHYPNNNYNYNGLKNHSSLNTHNNNNNNENNQHYYRRSNDTINEEPEWLHNGPTSKHDIIELRGFDEPINDLDDPEQKKSTDEDGDITMTTGYSHNASPPPARSTPAKIVKGDKKNDVNNEDANGETERKNGRAAADDEFNFEDCFSITDLLANNNENIHIDNNDKITINGNKHANAKHDDEDFTSIDLDGESRFSRWFKHDMGGKNEHHYGHCSERSRQSSSYTNDEYANSESNNSLLDFIRNGNFQKGSSTSSKESKTESAQNIHSVEELESRWRVVGKQRYSNHSSSSGSPSSASSDSSSMMAFKDFVNQMTIGQAQQQQQRNLMNILNAAAVANKNLIKPIFQMQQPQHFNQNQYAAAKDARLPTFHQKAVGGSYDFVQYQRELESRRHQFANIGIQHKQFQQQQQNLIQLQQLLIQQRHQQEQQRAAILQNYQNALNHHQQQQMKHQHQHHQQQKRHQQKFWPNPSSNKTENKSQGLTNNIGEASNKNAAGDNQLNQWFSPDLLAKAVSGKLPSLNADQAIKLDEYERGVLKSESATVPSTTIPAPASLPTPTLTASVANL